MSATWRTKQRSRYDWSDRLLERIPSRLGTGIAARSTFQLKVAVTAAELEVSLVTAIRAWTRLCARLQQFVAVSSSQACKEGITSSCILAQKRAGNLVFDEEPVLQGGVRILDLRKIKLQ